jgi:hypothetical protein
MYRRGRIYKKLLEKYNNRKTNAYLIQLWCSFFKKKATRALPLLR